MKKSNAGNKAYARTVERNSSTQSDTKGPLTFKRDWAKEGHQAPADWGACGSSAK
jgi:hypothetical protein